MFITSAFCFRYVFGDVSNPSEEAAILLESVVHNEMINVVSGDDGSGKGRGEW